MTEPLRTVLVAGGGITGWYAAAAIKRRAPFLDVTMLATRAAPDALADRIACTLPSIRGFHADLGIGEEDAVLRTGAACRLGTLFSGWADDLPDYAHVYDRYGQRFGPTSFHLHWLRARRAGRADAFDSYAPAAALARAGRFVPPTPGTPFADHDYGLTLDLPRQERMVRAFADHVGVRIVAGEIADVAIDDRGFVARLTLVGGGSLAADLVVDATGPAARLRGAIDQAVDDWSGWLPCDRLLIHAGAPIEPPVLTPVVAHAAGWRWSSGAQTGIAYAAAHADEAALTALMPDGDRIAIRPGMRRAPWRGNCVAVGDAATQVEPLEWCNLHLALSAIDRLVTMLPDAAMAPVEAADFNRQCVAEAERVRDFVALHYFAARRPEPMWRACAATPPPDSLAHTLTQFAERGRLPFYEEETFSRDEWAAVLIGQGVLPRRVDPLVEAVPADAAAAAMARHKADIAAAVPRTPTHAAWLAAQASRLSR